MDSYYKVELVPISDELETAMNKKAGEEFGARVQGMYNKLGAATSDASLVEQVWAALTDPYLIHAQYYKKETPEVIKKIADLIASDSAAVPPHDRLARICLTSRFLRSRLLALGLSTLENHFGHYGVRLHELARGIDNSEVIPDRPTQSISAEDTFEQDVTLAETEPMIRRLAETTWSASRKELRIARTVVLKLKTSDFKILTRSHTPHVPPSFCEELTSVALSLRERVGLGSQQRFRLVGVGLSNFREPDNASAQPALFE